MREHYNLSKKLEAVAIEVGTYLRREFEKSTRKIGSLKYSRKSDDSLVTKVDLASERLAMKKLRMLAPTFGYVSEETASDTYQALKNGDYFVIDPLDGTTNFVRGFPMFCFTAAAVTGGEIVAGVTYHPILNLSFRASLGGGSFLNNKKIRISSIENFNEAVLTTGFAYSKKNSLDEEMAAFAKVSALARAVRRPGSAALDMAYTALGVFDGFWERDLKPWDTAAGTLLVREAGGVVTDFQGRAYHLGANSILASNPRLQKKFMRSVQG